MGHRITQRILEFAVCGTIPDDGDYMWEMSEAYWCESCCDQEREEDKTDIPGFEGTMEALNGL